jgi:hypothetical protein
MDAPAALGGFWTAACPVLEAPSNHNDDSQPPPSSPGFRGFQCGEDGNAILLDPPRSTAYLLRKREQTRAKLRPHHPAIFRASVGMSVFAPCLAIKHCLTRLHGYLVAMRTARAVTSRPGRFIRGAPHKYMYQAAGKPSQGPHAVRCHRSIRSRAARARARLSAAARAPSRPRSHGAQPLKASRRA